MTQPLYLALYGSYQSLELALFCGQQKRASIIENKARASSVLIPRIQTLLQEQNVSLSNLDFIALDGGPGAFTSLRVIISTMNGIAMGSNIPLVAVDGLHALAVTAQRSIAQKHSSGNLYKIVCLLNAYNQEVYHATFAGNQESLQKEGAPSYSFIETFLHSFSTEKTGAKLFFVGNGAQLHRDKITTTFADQSCQILDIPHATIDSIASLGLEEFLSGQTVTEVQPLYLKKETFAVR